MPYTLSHAIAAYPFHALSRRHLPLSALVAGTISPDYPYFIHLETVGTTSHSPLGLLTECLPASLIILLFYYLFMKPAALALAPRRFVHLAGAAADQSLKLSPLNLILIPFAVILGATTHILWDSFTHSQGWHLVRPRFIDHIVFAHTPYAFPIYKLLQYTSGVVGLILIALWVLRWAQRQPTGQTYSLLPARIQLIAISLIGLTAITGIMISASIYDASSPGPLTAKQLLVANSIGSVSGIALGLTLTGIILRLACLLRSNHQARNTRQ